MLYITLLTVLFGCFSEASICIMLTVWAVTPIPALFHLLDLFLEKVWWVLKKQDLVFAVQTVQILVLCSRECLPLAPPRVWYAGAAWVFADPFVHPLLKMFWNPFG